jgi:steroid 5-alpha reductase family enzyme
MIVLYPEALVGIALSFSILVGFAWMVQQPTGNCGWLDTIRRSSVGAVGVGNALWPIAGEATNRRQWLAAGLLATWSLRLGLPIARRTAGISEGVAA